MDVVDDPVHVQLHALGALAPDADDDGVIAVVVEDAGRHGEVALVADVRAVPAVLVAVDEKQGAEAVGVGRVGRGKGLVVGGRQAEGDGDVEAGWDIEGNFGLEGPDAGGRDDESGRVGVRPVGGWVAGEVLADALGVETTLILGAADGIDVLLPACVACDAPLCEGVVARADEGGVGDAAGLDGSLAELVAGLVHEDDEDVVITVVVESGVAKGESGVGLPDPREAVVRADEIRVEPDGPAECEAAGKV